MTGRNARPATRAGVLGAVATLVVSFAVAFLALFSSTPADAGTTGLGTVGPRFALLPVTALPPVTAQYPVTAAAPSALVPKAMMALIGAAPHGPYTTLADDCATCHRTHTGKNANLVKSVSPQSNLCLSCHDGLGANTDVKAQFNDALVPANNDVTRVYYRHDTLNPAKPHISAGLNEFGGVSNRQSECGDCHNPHKANATNGTTTPPPSTGVTASGRLAGVSGVRVLNSPTAGLAPTYTFLDGKTPATSITYEYQLCFKCHSGFTTLSSNGSFAAQPSRFRLDKGAEFNPNNLSYHPIEAAGKNRTPDMSASLAGPSPYKIWNFTIDSTIRCVNCHASSTKFPLLTPPTPPVLNQPPPGGDLPMHTSRNPGILLQNYRNRILKTPSEPYADIDFALCYMCHAKAPLATETGTGTNFAFHGYHLTKLTGQGNSGTTIDTAGAGGGNAICAECHFRLHSTTFKAGTQTVSGAKLVSFSPNVLPYNGTISWTSTGVGTGSCNLTCHGVAHGKSY